MPLFRDDSRPVGKKKKMRNLVYTALFASIVATTVAPAAQGFIYPQGDNENYAIEYCRYYKIRAHVAARKERQAKTKKPKKYRRSTRLWAQYNACLKENGWPTPYRP